jgi:hypothetical protein
MGFFTDTKFDSVYDMTEAIVEVVERNVRDNFEMVSADKLGLDIRAGYKMFVNEDAIAVAKHNDRTLQYYGGFEYVDSEYRVEMGDFVFYMCDDERVRGHIEQFYCEQLEGSDE